VGLRGYAAVVVQTAVIFWQAASEAAPAPARELLRELTGLRGLRQPDSRCSTATEVPPGPWQLLYLYLGQEWN